MSSKVKLLIGGVLLVVIAAGAGVWWFVLRDTAPDKVSLDSATSKVDGSDKAGTSAEGDWKVDTGAGTFDFERADGTFAGFRVKENLKTVGDTTAVGRTGEVSGDITIGADSLEKTKVEVDLTSITTDQSLRDSRVQSALDTGTFPTATFELSKPVDLGDAVATGSKVSVKATGTLTLHGETKPVTAEIDAVVKGKTLVVVGSFPIDFREFGVTPPSAPIVGSVDPNATVEFQLLMAK